MTQIPSQNHSRKMEECRKVCSHCSVTCLQVLRFLLNENPEAVNCQVLITLQICADQGALTAKVLALGSRLHQHSCLACVGIAKACAEEIKRLEPNELLRDCCEMCLRCSELCEEMGRPEQALPTHGLRDLFAPH